MASLNIFAPTVNSYEPAFKSTESCKVYFVLSDYNTRAETEYAHASVVQAVTNFNVVNTAMSQDGEVKTASGTILNLPIKEVSNKPGLYYIEILKEYIRDTTEGWTTSSLYKIQIRLTEGILKFDKTGDAAKAEAQISWLNDNANKFSEWSTTISTKAIGEDYLEIPILNQSVLNSSNIDIIGTYVNDDVSEKMYSANIQIYKEDLLISDSGALYKSSLDASNKFTYSPKINLGDGDYVVKVTVTTVNRHVCEKDYEISIQTESGGEITLTLATLPYERGYEEDEGCIMLKIAASAPDETFTGTLRIRRASAADNFSTWEDLHEIQCLTATLVKDIPYFKDFTIESGAYYKYGLQEITWEGSQMLRSKLNITDEISRVFEYSFLLGEGGRQLKLRYNLGLSNYKKNYSDTITPTIGSKYPFTTRVGASDYYNFSMNGKISFSMDENNLFVEKGFVYGYNNESVINQYDFTYERKFREEVYKFLTDGKPKLFKSPSEGNLIVRLTGVSLSPTNNLSRLISDFSATATEIDEATIQQYRKYNFISELNTTILN